MKKTRSIKQDKKTKSAEGIITNPISPLNEKGLSSHGTLDNTDETVEETKRNKNAVIDATNSAPDYYTPTLSRADVIDDNLPTTGTNGLESVTDEVYGDVPDPSQKKYTDPNRVDLDEVVKEENMPANENTFVSSNQGGTVDEDAGESFTRDSDNYDAGTPGSSKVDEGTA